MATRKMKPLGPMKGTRKQPGKKTGEKVKSEKEFAGNVKGRNAAIKRRNPYAT